MRASTVETSRAGTFGSGSDDSSCMVETMMPMKRFRMVNVAMMMNGTKNAHAQGWACITGRTIPIDSWASPPVLLGTIDPPPTVLTLPHLHVPSPPQLGSPWRLDVLAPEGAPTFVAVSLVPTAGTQTPFGILSIDLTLAAVLGVAIPQPSHDPMASVTMPIPNAPAFLALPLAAQALVVPQTLAPRLTNAVSTAIQ